MSNISTSLCLRADDIHHLSKTVPESPSKWKTYGFITLLIVGIGGLAAGGAGVYYFHVGTTIQCPKLP